MSRGVNPRQQPEDSSVDVYDLGEEPVLAYLTRQVLGKLSASILTASHPTRAYQAWKTRRRDVTVHLDCRKLFRKFYDGHV
ncbi:hypothetical protein RUM44_008318 [Polyplax serrata]|uniref:Uncharacterized protein n=1 Tax=Polyplax serrata TaxID=468196 RepID=A0ABR1B806_POLSC